MKLKTFLLCAAAALLTSTVLNAQGDRGLAGSPEYIKGLTYLWQGPRLDDGRPAVSDDMIARLKEVAIEDAWAELMKLGYQNQYEGEWKLLHETEDAVMTGRAVTAQFMPMRPDLENEIIEQGKKEGRMWEQKRTVSWVINSLVKGDVYVADTYNKEFLGTAVGSNPATASSTPPATALSPTAISVTSSACAESPV